MRGSAQKKNKSVSHRKPVVHILYPSSWDVDKWCENHEKGLVPDRYQYGFDRLEKYGFKITYARFPQSWIVKKLAAIPNRLFTHTYSPYYFIFQLKHFLEADVFINQADHEGLMLCWLRKHKQLNLHKKIHIFIPAWLPDWIQGASNSRLKRLRSLIGTVDILMYFGEYDKNIFKDKLLIPEEKLAKTYWGVDADFFIPRQIKEKTFFLAPGTDVFRDYGILTKVARELPHEKFIIASSKKPILKINPPNLSIGALPHKELVESYQKAKAVIIPIKKGCHTASGSTVLKEALLLNKRVIVSATDLMRELTAGFEDHVTLVEPGLKEALKNAIVNLQMDTPLPELTPEEKMPLSSEYYMEKISKIIQSHLIT